MDTVSRFCRDCYQTTPHVRYPGSEIFECSLCKKSGRSITIEESKKEDTTMEMEEIVLRVLEKRGTATADEISIESKVPLEVVRGVLDRLETVGMLIAAV